MIISPLLSVSVGRGDLPLLLFSEPPPKRCCCRCFALATGWQFRDCRIFYDTTLASLFPFPLLKNDNNNTADGGTRETNGTNKGNFVVPRKLTRLFPSPHKTNGIVICRRELLRLAFENYPQNTMQMAACVSRLARSMVCYMFYYSPRRGESLAQF